MPDRRLPRRSRAASAAGLGAAWLLGSAVLDRLRQQDLDGQVALVTGGSRGLGLLLARELVRAGCRVAICARDVEDLNVAWRELESEGTEIVAIPCDVSDRADVARAVAAVEARLGPIDILVNNASIIQFGSVSTLGAEDFHAALDADFWGTVYPTLEVLPAMRARRSGRIVNVTSIAGRVGLPHLVPYTAAKFAATGFSEALRAEVARDGVTVTTIIPWFMRTGSYLRALFKPPRREEFTWFALGATLPGVSIDAESAARQIVAAIRRGDTERSIGVLAVASWRFHGLFPGITASLLGRVNRLLPTSPVEVGPRRPVPAAVPGEVAEQEIDSPMLEVATTLGRRAADRLNERTAEGVLAAATGTETAATPEAATEAPTDTR